MKKRGFEWKKEVTNEKEASDKKGLICKKRSRMKKEVSNEKKRFRMKESGHEWMKEVTNEKRGLE